MSNMYHDPKYDVEKIHTFPTCSAASTGVVAKIKLTENIKVTEFGIFVTTGLTGATNLRLALQNSDAAANIAVVDTACAPTVPIGSNVTASAANLIAPLSGNSGSYLILNVLTATTTGVVTPYMKYFSRFV